jgi:kynurenine formamidase
MDGKVIDLSLVIYDGAPTMPLDPKCSVVEHCNLDTLGYNLTKLTVSTHQGTHLDAPFHFIRDGVTVDRLDPAKCIGRAFKIDLGGKKPREPIGVADVLPHQGKLVEGSFVLLRTGWDKVYPDARYFSDFPYLTKELADWFADRKVGLVGMDMPTPNGTDWKYIHERMLGAGIVIVEGLADLDRIGAEEFLFIGLPLKIRGRDGSPIRAVAVV